MRAGLPAGLADRYKVLRVLGRGGFGRVLLAHDTELDRLVAIKVLASLMADQDAVHRFGREARLTARLSHPHVVALYDHGVEADGTPWIVYQYVEGKSLGEAIRKQKGLEADEVVDRAAEVADALAAVHEIGVVHRDLKPDNILLSDGGAILCDFGLAWHDDPKTIATQEGLVLGTPAYMAPELWRGLPPSPLSDQFGWGATLYEVVYGRPIIESADPMDVIQRIESGRPFMPPPGQDAPAEPLGGVMFRALNFRPESRFASMSEARDALRGLISSGPGETIPSGVMPLNDLRVDATPSGLQPLPSAAFRPGATASGQHLPAGASGQHAPAGGAGAPPAPRSRALPFTLGALVLAATVGFLLPTGPAPAPPPSPPPEVSAEDAPPTASALAARLHDLAEDLVQGHRKPDGKLKSQDDRHKAQLVREWNDPRLPLKYRRFLQAGEDWMRQVAAENGGRFPELAFDPAQAALRKVFVDDLADPAQHIAWDLRALRHRVADVHSFFKDFGTLDEHQAWAEEVTPILLEAGDFAQAFVDRLLEVVPEPGFEVLWLRIRVSAGLGLETLIDELPRLDRLTERTTQRHALNGLSYMRNMILGELPEHSRDADPVLDALELHGRLYLERIRPPLTPHDRSTLDMLGRDLWRLFRVGGTRVREAHVQHFDGVLGLLEVEPEADRRNSERFVEGCLEAGGNLLGSMHPAFTQFRPRIEAMRDRLAASQG